MLVIDGPPPAGHLGIGARSSVGVPTLSPRLVGADKVGHADGRLEVSIGGNVLIVGRRSHVIGEAYAVVAVLEVHVQQALVSAVERDATLGHGHQGVVLAHIGRQDHDSGVEEVRPANVRGGGEGMGQLEELVGSSVSDDVRVYVDDLAELGLLPEVQLGEGRVEIRPAHEVEICRMLILDPADWDDIVVYGLGGSVSEGEYGHHAPSECKDWKACLELCYDLHRQSIQCHQNGELLGGTGIPKGMCEHQGTFLPRGGESCQRTYESLTGNWDLRTHPADKNQSGEAVRKLGSASDRVSATELHFFPSLESLGILFFVKSFYCAEVTGLRELIGAYRSVNMLPTLHGRHHASALLSGVNGRER